MKHEVKYIPDEYLQPESWITKNIFSSSYFENPMTESLDLFDVGDIKFKYVSNYEDQTTPENVTAQQKGEGDSEKKTFNRYNQEDRKNFERYLAQYGDEQFNEWFLKMAALESAFVQKPDRNPSYCGWFQINKAYLNYYTGQTNITKKEFVNSPKLQFTAAKNLAKEMLTNIKRDKIIMAWAKKRGYTKWDLLAGCWLGGFGNLKNLIYSGKDFSDGNGTKISARINNYKNIKI